MAARALSQNDLPKYLFARGFRKSEYLYGLHAVATSRGPIVVVEGATDVWRLGRNAVGLFGNSISKKQIELLIIHARARPIIVLLDRGMENQAGQIASKIESARRLQGDTASVKVAEIPADYEDPGDCPRDLLWQHLASLQLA